MFNQPNFSTILQEKYQLHFIDFPGHGSLASASGEQTFSMGLFEQYVLNYMEDHQIAESSFFGFSMGGYVAIKLALSHPEKVKKVMTLGTKFFWTEEEGKKEAAKLSLEFLLAKAPHFIESLKKIHGEENIQQVLTKTQDLLLSLGHYDELPEERLKEIKIPLHLCVGDRDDMAGAYNTLKAFQSLPKDLRKLTVFPATKHNFEFFPPEKLANYILHHW